MSKTNPGGGSYVPAGTRVRCAECGATVTLSPGNRLLRRHVDPGIPSDQPRRERVCPSSRTEYWQPITNTTKESP